MNKAHDKGNRFIIDEPMKKSEAGQSSESEKRPYNSERLFLIRTVSNFVFRIRAFYSLHLAPFFHFLILCPVDTRSDDNACFI
jgi:hypothetical protein